MRRTVTPPPHLPTISHKEERIRSHHPDLSEEVNATLDELCGYWRVGNDFYRLERAPEGGIMAEECRTGEEVSAAWVTLRGLPIDHPLCGREF